MESDTLNPVSGGKQARTNAVYLEKDLPVERLYLLARKEANSKRPIYRIHKWWARRLGSVFRMLLLTALSPTAETAPSLWKKYYEGASFSNKVILDPFVGGGTSMVEALRVGCKVIGVDINPVAWFVTKKEIEPFNLELAEKSFHEIDKRVGLRIKRFYTTKCSKGHPADIIHTLWIKRINCRQCGKEAMLFRDYIVFEDQRVRVIVCPKCLEVFRVRPSEQHNRCVSCGHTFDVKEGVVSNGVYECPHCSKSERVTDAAMRLGSPLQAHMFCIEFLCSTCGRGFKSPDKSDHDLYDRACAQLLKRRNDLLFPRNDIPMKGRWSSRPANHGYWYFHQLFNDRQLLCLAMLLEEIKVIQDQNMKEFFLLAFSNCLETNNVLCKYESRWGKVSALFSLPGYHVPERFAENNVWGTRFGRGTFLKCFEKLRNGKTYALNAYEHVYADQSKRPKRQYTGEHAVTDVARDYKEMMNSDKRALLFCQSSEDLSFIPSRSVDAILTDPPYYDTIMYSELADFFYVWMRMILKDEYTLFEPPTSKREHEMIVNFKSNKSADGFIKTLGRVLGECNRVLSDDGIMVFTFHHAKPWAWRGVSKALADAGFKVTATPVIRSEGKTGYQKRGNTRLDVCVVCRKRQLTAEDPQFSLVELRRRTLRQSIHIVRRLEKIDRTLDDPDISTIVMGQSLKYSLNDAFGLLEDLPNLVKVVKGGRSGD